MSGLTLRSTAEFDAIPMGDAYRINLRKTIGSRFPKELVDYVDQGGKFEKITIFSDDFSDYEYLKKIETRINSLSLASKSVDWDLVFDLQHLVSLTVRDGCNPISKDITTQESLKLLFLHSNPGMRRVLRGLGEVRALSLSKFGLEDLQSIRTDKLEFLEINHSRKVSSLSGIESFPKLRVLRLECNSKLLDISAVSTCNKLTFLYIVRNKRIADYSYIGDIGNLRELILVGDVDSPHWLTKNSSLAYLNLDCVSPGKNLDFLYELPSLQYARIRDRRGQSVKNREIQAFLSDKGFDLESLKLGTADGTATGFSARYKKGSS